MLLLGLRLVLRPISILNRQTNTNTFYIHRVTLYIRNEPFHSASLSDYDAYALPTKASHYAPTNSSTLYQLCLLLTTITPFLNELIKYLNDRGYNLSFLKKEIQRVHAITRNETLKPSQTTTNQPSRVPLVITYNPTLRSISRSYKDILKSFRLRHDATTSFKLHPLLLSDEPTTLVTF